MCNLHRKQTFTIPRKQTLSVEGMERVGKFAVMARHGRKPRPSSGIEKAADRQGWRATSVTHTTSHIHNALSRASPVLTHFSLTARSSLTHTHRFLGLRNSINPRHSACIFSETDDSPSCICQQISLRARTLPMPTLLAHTHTQVPRFSQLNPRHSACIFGETDDSPSCICQQSGETVLYPMCT